MTQTLLLLPGDGIGPEVTAQSRLLIAHLNAHENLDVQAGEALFGGASIDVHGVPLTQDVKQKALAANAVLMGAVGGPKWAGAAYDTRPEAGLLALRSAMDVYANLRPAICFDALADASSLKREYVEGLNLLFVRELTGGVYFGHPRGIEDLGNGQRRGVNTHVYTTAEIRRVADTAFRLASTRSGRLCSAEKSNVMEAGLLWREEVQKLRDEAYPDIELSHMLADNMAMQLVKAPKQFDVIVTDNLFGDILADEAAMLTGSLGMMPSAALGDAGKPGLYEPIHGSAPDIAGRGIANPCASILSLAMAMRYSLGRPDLAVRIEAAVSQALGDGIRSGDIGGDASTAQMGAAVISRI